MPEKIEDYEVLDVIGTGSFGTCYKVRKKNDGNIYVWKAINYKGMTEDKKQLLVSEVNLLSELRHPNIVRYYDRIIHKGTATLYIIMEWCQGGDLASLIKKCKKSGSYLDEGFIWRALYQLSRALYACHWHQSRTVIVLHRDIKPANVFLDEAGNVKLGDFGLARILQCETAFAETVVGTPYYMSPEVIRSGKYNRKSDMWSLGCLIYELCSLSPPFIGQNIKELAQKIKEGKCPRIPTHYSDDLQKIVSFLLSVDQSLRPSIEIILHHPTVVSHITQETLKHIAVKRNSDTSKSDDELNDELSTAVKKIDELHFSTESKDDLALINKNKGNMENICDILQNRLQFLKQREASLRLKELKIDERERTIAKKEKELAMLDRLAKEKVARAEVYLHQCRETRSVVSSIKTSLSKQHSADYADIDTSYSADPGDTSILPTSSKLKPEYVSKPVLFQRVGSQRRVHFGTLPHTKSRSTLTDESDLLPPLGSKEMLQLLEQNMKLRCNQMKAHEEHVKPGILTVRNAKFGVNVTDEHSVWPDTQSNAHQNICHAGLCRGVNKENMPLQSTKMQDRKLSGKAKCSLPSLVSMPLVSRNCNANLFSNFI